MDEELLTRQMPHSVEAEQAVLGSMLIDARCVPEVIDQLIAKLCGESEFKGTPEENVWCGRWDTKL